MNLMQSVTLIQRRELNLRVSSEYLKLYTTIKSL